MTKVRQPLLAGTWYPAPPRELAATVDRFRSQADPRQRPAGQPWLAVTPHAGFSYSGPVAGRVFGLLGDGRPDRVFILAPNHRLAINQVALPDESFFATPLGKIPVDRSLVDELATKPGFALNPAAHAREHAVEVVLPFVQRTWPDKIPAIVPLLVPHLPWPVLQSAGLHLAEIRGKNDLLLISSDFTHYGTSFGFVPFTENIPLALEQLDAGALLKILSGDAAGLYRYGQETGITMCGLPACCLALAPGPPAGHEAALLDYRRSADESGDFSQSVSYAAVLISTGPENP